MHFHSGPLMYFRSGVDTRDSAIEDWSDQQIREQFAKHLPGAIEARGDAHDKAARRDKGSLGHGLCPFQK
jgi:hypothetical protein